MRDMSCSNVSRWDGTRCESPISGERMVPLLILTAGLVFMLTLLFAARAAGAEKRGNLVLSFDDGYPSWIKTIAPELAKAGGVATGYVNNFRIHAGVLSFEDLRQLQNRYGWEIGSHTFNHFDPTIYVELHGLSAWVRDELDASIAELKAHGLNVRSLVFPFNRSSEQIRTEALTRVRSFRRDDEHCVTSGIDRDGSFPGKAIDIEHYVPNKKIFGWIDEAQRTNRDLFLYGHRVLADDEFRTGQIKTVGVHSLTATATIAPETDTYLCVVPDTQKSYSYSIMVTGIHGAVVHTWNGDLTHLANPGDTFLLGPCMATRLSDFRKIIRYAAARLNFRTVSETLPSATAASAAGK